MTVGAYKARYVRIAFLFLVAIMAVVCFASVQQLSVAAAQQACTATPCKTDAFCESIGGGRCRCFLPPLPPGSCHPGP